VLLKVLAMAEQFIIASRDPSAPIDSTVRTVQDALQHAVGSRVVSVDRKTSIVVVEIPQPEVERVRTALGSAFMFDPNPKLHY
jgi:hypothetical protein